MKKNNTVEIVTDEGVLRYVPTNYKAAKIKADKPVKPVKAANSRPSKRARVRKQVRAKAKRSGSPSQSSYCFWRSLF